VRSSKSDTTCLQSCMTALSSSIVGKFGKTMTPKLDLTNQTQTTTLGIWVSPLDQIHPCRIQVVHGCIENSYSANTSTVIYATRSTLCSRAVKKLAEVPSPAMTRLVSCSRSYKSKYSAAPDIRATQQIAACSLRYRRSGRAKPSIEVKVTTRWGTVLRFISLVEQMV